ncbi:GntR family transcriptional regulator [Roseisolibacter sp. H3M3-2]|uniref:GntR family transcriptional regulator n=1 Tax=Roseisolibacter sp. H3M3-2 TaxID=3031323 RepID=UPI0023D9A8DE|nr:GntR family transcriptional regulator [Roseisolibacter sp. H3M3-2]MDF1501342.1 GntR family transcriptional regulator [Roseisolibacter sp. H3M3-2]
MARRDDISDTLRQRVLSALHFGTLRAGSRLPSARVLAAELNADPRVVIAAYRSLEAEGVVERRPPSRAHFVVETRPAAGALAPTAEWLVEVFAGGLARGVPAPDFPEHARRHFETLRLRAVCVECNRDQLVWLCRELQEDYGVVATGVEIEALRDDEPLPPALRSADLLVTSASHAEEVQRLGERLSKPVVVATIRPDLSAEIARLLAEGPLYFVGTDPRLEGKLQSLFPDAPTGHVRTILVGRDDVGAIPEGAPAYVLRTARDLLGGVPAHLRPLSTLRAFAPETQREILRFILRGNAAALGARS